MTIRQSLNKILADKNFQLLEDRLNQESIFHILNVQKREVTHSAFVAWLLNPSASHGMNFKPLKSFLLQACGLTMEAVKNQYISSNHEFIDIIALDKIDFNMVQVQTEFALNNKRRMDILGSITQNDEDRVPILIIEYKVEAKETNQQTKEYSSWAKKQPKYLGKYDPIHIYLVPDNNDESEPADPFVIMDYDEFNKWLIHLNNFEKTSQAEFLISEFRSCLRKQEYMMDEKIERLIENIKDSNRDEISMLSEAKYNDLDVEVKNSIRIHQKGLERLEVFMPNKASKGTSEFIKFVKHSIGEKISKEQWKFNSTSGCLAAKNMNFSIKLKSLNEELSKIYLQFWMERPSNERGILKLEIAGGGSQLKETRVKLANSLREYLNKVDGVEQGREGSGIVIYRALNFPGVKSLEDDTEENVIKFKECLIQAINSIIEAASEEKLNRWMDNELQKNINI
ncbi:hypothetical protein CPJCM30710_32930 [Clostridium polyendosporum]|uniref:PD-(D/E)XK nuclease superfamily protein n=1 Tax=Clostridium polyendosporum TaxID=69208 RepID=A0A919S1Y8_9CLOT|nr:PD-(D/E)XK nuclease family protein [Clostridium polyendosporum]GIM30627.1 hypothetical protein CPJCM30710_32930 [Clostridium polyendosporum]